MEWVGRLKGGGTRQSVARVGGVVAAVLSVLWVLYWYCCLRRRPRLTYLRTERNERIVQGCPSLFRPYSPPLFAPNAHAQLILHWLRNRLFPKKSDNFWLRETLTLADGGTVTLDWATGARNQEDEENPTVQKTVVLLHGLAGGSEDYVELARLGVEEGWRVIVYNRRGHSRALLTTKKLTAFGDAKDFKEVLEHLTKRLPDSPLYAIGVSAGSGVLVSYLGEAGDSSPLQGGVAVSPGFDLIEFLMGTPNLSRSEELRQQRDGNNNNNNNRKKQVWDSRVSPFYDKIMMSNWKQFLRQHIDHFEDVVSWKEIESCARFTEYEAKIGWQLYGFDSLEQYLKECNPMRNMGNVKVPVLVMCALDDPICKRDLIYFDVFHDIEAGILATTDFGSHTTWLTGLFRLSSWKDRVALEFLQSLENMAVSSSSPIRR